jgi:integrase
LIYQGKTDRYKQIPLTEPLQLILKSRQKEGDRPLAYVFSKGGNINPKFYRILREACELCEIPYGQRNPDGIVLHTARHTVTTRLVNAGLDFDTIGQITGHSAKELILHYTHHTPGSMQRAAAALGEVGQIKDRKENP